MTQSATSRAASLLGRRSDDDDEDFNNPGIFAMSIRVPSLVACKISVMAEHAKCSRNEMANLIIQAGLESIAAAISEEVLIEIHEDVEHQIDNFIN